MNNENNEAKNDEIIDVLDTNGKEFVCFIYDTKSFNGIYELKFNE